MRLMMGKAKMATPEQEILARKLIKKIYEARDEDGRGKSYNKRLDWSHVNKVRDKLVRAEPLTEKMYIRVKDFAKLFFQIEITNSINIMFGE